MKVDCLVINFQLQSNLERRNLKYIRVNSKRMFFLAYIIPTCFQIMGIYLLLKVKHKCEDQPQYWHLLSMSCVELSYCLHCLATGIVKKCTRASDLTKFIMVVVGNSGLLWFYFMIMLVILFDRFMEIYLHMHYHRVCSLRRTKLVLSCSLLLSICVTLICVFCIKTAADIHRFFTMFFWPPMCVIYFGSAVAVYGYIRWKRRSLAKILAKVCLTTNLTGIASSTRRIINQSKHRQLRIQKNLFLPTLLVSTFLFFWVLPMLLLFIQHCNPKLYLHQSDFLVACLVMLGLIMDVVVYVLMYRPVRSYLKRNTVSVRGERTPRDQTISSTL